MQEWLIQLIGHYQYLIYGIIIFISFLEGPILAMVCGVVLKLNYLSFLPVYFALMVGDLIGDVFWYFIGYKFGHGFIRRFGKYFSIDEEAVSTVTRIFHSYKNRILIISKMTMGFGFALVTLITAGIVKIPFRRYIFLNFVGQFFWTGILLLIGYSLGQAYISVNNILGKISIVALFIIIFFGLMGYGKYVKSKITQSIQV